MKTGLCVTLPTVSWLWLAGILYSPVCSCWSTCIKCNLRCWLETTSVQPLFLLNSLVHWSYRTASPSLAAQEGRTESHTVVHSALLRCSDYSMHIIGHLSDVESFQPNELIGSWLAPRPALFPCACWVTTREDCSGMNLFRESWIDPPTSHLVPKASFRWNIPFPVAIVLCLLRHNKLLHEFEV